MNNKECDTSVSIMEQHIGTILQITVIGLLGWSLMTTVELRTSIGVMQAKMEAVQTTLSQGTSDRYRGSDASRDFKAVWDEMNRRDDRLSKVESKMRELAEHVHKK